MTHEELREILNTDLTQPHPDPDWDYYETWNSLLKAKGQIEDLITFISQVENATDENDLEINSRLETVIVELNELTV